MNRIQSPNELPPGREWKMIQVDTEEEAKKLATEGSYLLESKILPTFYLFVPPEEAKK